MWINYLKITWRNILRQRSYSILKIMSLSIGLAAFIYVLLYVRHEFSYDKHLSESNNIYRVVMEMNRENAGRSFFHLMHPLKEELQKSIPQVDVATHFYDAEAFLLRFEDKEISGNRLIYGDKYFLKVFDYEVVAGNPDEFLSQPKTMVLTQSMAEKLFGDKDPLNNFVTDNDNNNYLVTGIIQDIPNSTHLPFSAVASYATFYQDKLAEFNYDLWFGYYGFPTYVKLTENASIQSVTKQLNNIYDKNIGYKLKTMGVESRFFLQKVTDIHLHSNFIDEFETNSNIQTVYIVLVSGLFILLIGCFNFINLSTAKSMKRAREVGMRKTLGGFRKQIIHQFLGESVLFTLLSLFAALILLEIFLPWLNHISGTNIRFSFSDVYTWGAIFSITLITALLAGTYPAFYLSAFNPITVLKGNFNQGHTKNNFRNTLVLIQFIISITLITGTFIINKQLQYIQNKNLGYNKEQTLAITYHKDGFRNKYKDIMAMLYEIPEIKSLSAAMSDPVDFNYSEGYLPEGTKTPVMTTTFPVDDNYLETMGIKLKQGRFFNGETKTDSAKVVINETMVKELDWKTPVGKIIERNGVRYTVIGVVENFHFQSLHRPISRLIMRYDPDRFNTMLIRLQEGQVSSATLNKIENIWKSYEREYPFEYHFLDQKFAKQYKNDQQFGNMIIYFSLLAIFIACTGLFGLAAFSSEQRIREIGIRKVFGASEKDILKMMISQFVKWVLIAAALAIPLSYYLMNRWLDDFAFHTKITMMPFVLATLSALIIAASTVWLQSLKAARLNPAKTIKYE